MRIKNTAFVYHVTVNGSSNCDWGQDIGQGKKHTFTLEGFPEVLNAMVYYKIDDPQNLRVKLGKGKQEFLPVESYAGNKLMLASCFNKVYLNDRLLEGQRFVMYIIKDIRETTGDGKKNIHLNRCTLKFSDSLRYNGKTPNLDCIHAITEAFGLKDTGSWAILEMNIENEDELHFKGFDLGDSPTDYISTDARNDDFALRYDGIRSLTSSQAHEVEAYTPQEAECAYMAAVHTKPFLILGGCSGTGKSQTARELAFATCPRDGVLDANEATPGNYLMVAVKPNWHDPIGITGFRSSVNRNYYVTDFMRFLVKAMRYERKKVPFFVCLDEMNLAHVEEYFADFLSVVESRKKSSDGTIISDPLVPDSVFNDTGYAEDFNIFMSLGLETVQPGWTAKDVNGMDADRTADAFAGTGCDTEMVSDAEIVRKLKAHGLTLPQNVIIIGTVNVDDTVKPFSRKVIDRAMTFETVIGRFSVDGYFGAEETLSYVRNPLPGKLFIADEVKATELPSDYLTDKEKQDTIDFINDVNSRLAGTPFQISYRIINETVLLLRSKREIENIVNAECGGFAEGMDFHTDMNHVFDDILMQKVLPRIGGDYEMCGKCLNDLSKLADEKDWTRSYSKLESMIRQFGDNRFGSARFWS